ncbi:hypothetical protein ANN_26500 [Periplaneta americana]|uniref:Uncharacterized protein n=1 Tax=Periplaneta americana TaxID=6978 RepID=A0ABQ8RY89_PERAM|nr:hypothetical protein ANN_26500 [Periplaneta americana]
MYSRNSENYRNEDLIKKKLTSVRVSKQFTFLPLQALLYVSNPRELHEKPLHNDRVTVWCAVGILVPYFFEEDGATVTVNSQRYTFVINNFLAPRLNALQIDQDYTVTICGISPEYYSKTHYRVEICESIDYCFKNMNFTNNRQFSAGRQNVHDEERSGRPTIITDDLLEQRTICLLMTLGP